jgi:hypothetical protein
MTTLPWSQLMQQAEEAGVAEALPASIYNCVVSSAAPKAASTGKQMIACTFRVEDGPYANKPVWNNFVIDTKNPNATAYFFRHMAALGIDKSFFAMNPSLEQVAEALKGKRCKLKLSVRQWQGEDRNNVDSVMPPDGSASAAPQQPTGPDFATQTAPTQPPAVETAPAPAIPPQEVAAQPAATPAPGAPPF